ncbi:MAG: metallophosphoesterase family protein [Actinomycetota bacterium]
MNNHRAGASGSPNDGLLKQAMSRRSFFRWLLAGVGGLLVGSAAIATTVLRRRTEGKWIAAAGDVAANRNSEAAVDTSELILDDSSIQHVLVMGDVQYSGSYELYDSTWGQFRDRSFPCPGNHDYGSSGPIDLYDDYWGSLAPKQNGRNYAKDLECGWTLFSLDSDAGYEPSLTWLDEQLAALPDSQKIVAFWHHPIYTEEGTTVDAPNVVPMFEMLMQHRCDLVLYGHKHNYARYPRMGSSGRPEPDGPFCLLAGTGGMFLNTELANGGNLEATFAEYGVLKLFLSPDGFRGAFVDITGATLDTIDDGDGGLIQCLRGGPA